MTPLCTWDADEGWTTPDGRPCPKTHCALKGRCAHHVDTAAGIVTCPSCIGKVRRDLRAVAAMYAVDLPDEAADSGTNSEAVNMLGPAVPGVGVDWRRGWCEWPHRDEHPLIVLGDWDMALRERYGPATTLRITVPRAVAYLSDLLAGDFPHGDEFEAFAKSIAALRVRMERVIHDERGPDKGAPCPTCQASDPDHAPRLVKRWADGKGADAVAGRHDTWHCPADPEHWWSQADYELTIEAAHRERVKAGRWLTIADLCERTGRKPGWVRKWAMRDRIRTRWIGGSLHYSYDDTRALLDEATTSA